MYLTAQRVRSPKGEVGVNAVLHSHASDAQATDWDRPDLQLIVTSRPGDRIAERCEIAPPGNAVECFLDVVARDGTERESIDAALDQLARRVAATSRCDLSGGPVAVEFCLAVGQHERGLAERRFAELRAAATKLLEARTELEWRSAPPLIIAVDEDADGFRFHLPPETYGRVAAHRSATSPAASLYVRRDVEADFRRVHGSVFPFAAEWLTGLSRARLLALGGVRFVRDGAVLAEWPRR